MVTEAPIRSGRALGAAGNMSGKERLLAALKAHADPKRGTVKVSTADLARECGLDEHEVVHFIREGLARQNLITYREYRSGSVSALRLTPLALGRTYTKEIFRTPWFINKYGENPSPEVLALFPTESTKESNARRRNNRSKKRNGAAPISENLEISSPEKFPLIESLVNRRSSLDAAAKLAESAGAEDIALALMERAETPLMPLEQEAIDLWNAFMACTEKS